MGGKCRNPWDAHGDSDKDNNVCSKEDLRMRAMFLEKCKMQGLDMISNMTGCRLPCDRMAYSSIEVSKVRAGLVFPRKTSHV